MVVGVLEDIGSRNDRTGVLMTIPQRDKGGERA